MYNLITAFAKSSDVGKAWVETDLSNVTLYTMQSLYDKIYLHVQSDFEPGVTKRVDWCEVRRGVVDLSITMAEFLLLNGNSTLPSYPTLCKLTTGVVKYADAVQAGYTIDIINRDYAPGSAVSKIDAKDIYMTKEGVSPFTFQSHCLTTVNDLLHFADADDEYVYIAGANDSSRRSGRNELGIINFMDVSKITCVPITANMLHRESETSGLGDCFHVKVPEHAKGKLVGLVLGGYLYLRNSKAWRSVSNDVYACYPKRIGLVDRIFESEGIIDLSSLKLERAGRDGKQLSKEQLYSDDVIKAYATLSQSFLVVFDNPELVIEHIGLQRTTLPGMYLTSSQPTLPVMYKKGMLASYRFQRDEGMYAIRTTRNEYNHYLMNTTTLADNPADNRVPHNPRKESNASFWKASTTTISFE